MNQSLQHSKNLPRWLTRLVLCLLLAASGLLAQVENATLTGTVKDSSGGIIVGAKVLVTSTTTGQKRTLQTNSNGTFVASSLPPGTYTVEVQHPGFETYRREALTLTVAQILNLDLDLSPGTLQQQVVVSDTPSPLQTESANLGQVITHQQVVDLPLNGRNFLNLATLSGGTSTSEPGSRDSQQGGFSSNGNRSYDNNIMLDGVDDNSLSPDQRNGTDFILSPPPDALEEFRVETTGYGPEFGRGGGAAVNVVSRSGTNALHFTLWEFLRNNDFDARNFFDQTNGAPSFKQNQFGATIGGPVIKNKLFYFGDYQGTRQVQAQSYVSIVPTAQEKLGNYSDGFLGTISNPSTGLPYPNQQIPTDQMDPIALKLAQLYPNPNVAGTNQYSSNPVWTINTDQFDIRVDEPLTTNTQLFERVDWSRQNREQPGAFPGPGLGVVNNYSGSTMHIPAVGTALGLTHVFSPNLVNDFRFGYSRLNIQQLQYFADQNLDAQYGIPGIPFVSGLSGGLPNFNISDVRHLGTSGCFPTEEITNAYTYRDVFSATEGRHTMRMGFEFRPTEFTILQPCDGLGTFDYSGQFSGSGFADFLLGMPNDAYLANFANIDYLRRNSAGFFGDTWRVNSKLTLNLGLRWEYHTPVEERFSAQASLGFNNTYYLSRPATLPSDFPFPTAQAGSYLSSQHFNDWAPRLGLAYQLDSKTVFRMAYGIFWQAEEIGTFSNPSPGFNPPFYIDAQFPAVSTAQVNPTVNVLGNGFPANASTLGFNPFSVGYVQVQPNLQDAYVQEWNVSVQRQLSSSMTLEVSYIGNRATHLINFAPGNQATPSTDPNSPIQPRRPISILDTGTGQILSNGYSDYNALVATLRRNLATGLALNIAYTYSHALDIASSSNLGSGNNGYFRDAYNQFIEYGNADFDARHRLSALITYRLPFGTGQKLAGGVSPLVNSVIGGWNLYSIVSLQSGRWFTATSAVDTSNSGSQNPRPDLVCNPNANAPHTPAEWFNTGCFVGAQQGTYGNAGRNIIEGPGLANTDLSLVKDWSFSKEGRRVEFRAEGFNIFNRTNFAQIDDLVQQDTTFGQIRTALPSRQLQLAMKLYW